MCACTPPTTASPSVVAMVSGVAAGAEGSGRPEGILGPGHRGAHGVDQVGTVSMFMIVICYNKVRL